MDRRPDGDEDFAGRLLDPSSETMSYHHHHARRRALGATADDVAAAVVKARETAASLAKTLGPGLGIAAGIINDPALPKVLERLKTIKQLAATDAVSTGVKGGTGKSGLGLKNLVRPLDAYIYIQRNKWALPVGAAAALSIPFLLGFWLGRHGR